MRGPLALAALAILAVNLWAPAPSALSASRREYREAIRSMPLLERPNRFGHIYGNTVRRLYYRRHGHLPQHQEASKALSDTPAQPAPSPAIH